MEKNELITLETVLKSSQNTNGFRDKKETVQTEIFCAVKSAGRKEYYEAARSGKKASLIFVINRDDFETAVRIIDGKKVKPSRVIYDGIPYLIGREYVKGEGYTDMELTCEEVE